MSSNGKNATGKVNDEISKKVQLFLKNKISFKDLPNKAKIELLETQKISLGYFLENMVPRLKRYWNIILDLLKEQRIIRNTQFAEKLTKKNPVDYDVLNKARGLLSKFVEWGALTQLKRPGEKHLIYLCNLPDFYSADELKNLSPEYNKVKILNSFGDGWELVESISSAVNMKPWFLEQLLSTYVDEGLLNVKVNAKNSVKFYRLDKGLKEIGVISAETIRAFSIIKANNALEQEQERSAMAKKFGSLSELAKLQEEDLNRKIVRTKDINVLNGSAKFAFVGELSLGHQFADVNLINYFLGILREFGPDFLIASDFVQGDFKGIQVDRLRTLARVGGLNKVSVQHGAAHLVLKELEKITKQKVVYQLSDDDWQISVSRALIALEQYMGLRKSGLSSMFPEEIKRLSGEDYRRFMKFQWTIIQPYMYRIGRTLFNAEEVKNIIGEEISEYLLIVFIMLFERRGIEIPNKWKLIVDMEALHGNKRKSKLEVTPDPIILRLGDEFSGKIIKIVHNMGFSSVTQYSNSLQIPEMVSRHLQARGVETPFLLADFHQERFFGTLIGKNIQSKNPTFVFNLPGCKNTILDATSSLKSFVSFNILSDKVHRQNTFRKEPSTPAITCFEVFPDSRIKFRLLTHRVQDVIETNKGKPEEKELMAIFQDLQFGSIQMRPEWVIKAHDYALFAREATIADYNGDIIQGINYKQTYAENRPTKLVSVSSQQSFAGRILEPFYPSPKIKRIQIRTGNHEWNTFGAAEAGQNNLLVFFKSLSSYFMGLGRTDISVICDSRVRLKNSPNPGGATINWPYTTGVVAGGFKYAIQHKWAFSEGGGAINTMVQWVNRMAGSVGDVDLLIAGHKHMFATGLVGEKLFLQLPGLIDQSGYEMAGGYMPQSLLVLVEFSNKEGITVELVPMEFLENYKCQSPAYKDIDAQGLLDRPKPGTVDYKYGRDSAYIHSVEDEIDSEYREV